AASLADRPSLDVLFEHLLEFRFPDRSNLLLHNLSALEQENRGDPANPVPVCSLLVGINVEFADFQFACVLRRYLVYCRTHHPARAAPLRPKIHQNGHLGIQYIFVKRVVSEGQRVVACHLNLLSIDEVYPHFDSRRLLRARPVATKTEPRPPGSGVLQRSGRQLFTPSRAGGPLGYTEGQISTLFLLRLS